MRAFQSLPEGYTERFHVNLQTDKKTALWINISAAAAMVVLLVIGHFFFMPFTSFSSEDDSVVLILIKAAVLLGGYVAYIILHELTHAAAMKTAGAKKLRFGFTGLYAYAGSLGDYFDKSAYIITALAPLIVWGLVFTVMLISVPANWFWVVYFLQIGNIVGAAGDIYITFKTLKMPENVLIKDTGIEMFMYL